MTDPARAARLIADRIDTATAELHELYVIRRAVQAALRLEGWSTTEVARLTRCHPNKVAADRTSPVAVTERQQIAEQLLARYMDRYGPLPDVTIAEHVLLERLAR